MSKNDAVNWDNEDYDNDEDNTNCPRVNSAIGASLFHFDRNFRMAIFCRSSGEIIAATEPCLSALEADRINESMSEFFEIAIYESRVAIRCVPNGNIVAKSESVEAARVIESPTEYFELFVCPADDLDLSDDELRALQLACE